YLRVRAPELEPVASAQSSCAADLLAVHERAVARPEVLDVHVAVAVKQARVDRRRVMVLRDDDAAAPAASDGDLVGHRVGLAVVAVGVEQPQPGSTAALTLGRRCGRYCGRVRR